MMVELIDDERNSVNIFYQCLCKLYQWQSEYSGRSRGGAGGPAHPSLLIFEPNWGPKGQKKFFKTRPPLSQGLDDRALPLSEGLDPPLEYNNVPPLNGVSQSENALNGIYQR